MFHATSGNADGQSRVAWLGFSAHRVHVAMSMSKLRQVEIGGSNKHKASHTVQRARGIGMSNGEKHSKSMKGGGGCTSKQAWQLAHVADV